MFDYKNKAALGSKIGLLTSVFILITNFLLRSYFVKVYGVDLTGYYLLIVQLMGMLNLAELGVGTALTYILFKPLHDGNKQELSVLYYIIKKIYNIISLVIFCLGIVFSLFLRDIVDIDISSLSLYAPWIIFVTSTSLSYLYSSQSVLLTADQSIYIVKLFTGSAKCFTYVIQIVLMACRVEFWIVCLVELLSSFILIILFELVIKKNYLYLSAKASHPDREYTVNIKKKIKKEIKYTFIHKVAGVAVFNTDYLIISIYLGVSVITPFSSYMMLIQAFGFIIAAVASPLGAYIGKSYHSLGQSNTLKTISLFNSLFFIIASFCAYIFYMSSTGFIKLWMGDAIFLNPYTVFLLSLNCFVLVARTSFDAAKIGMGYMSDVGLPLLEALINILLSIILVHYIGIDGVIIGTLVSNIIVVLILKPIYLYKKALKQDGAFILKELGRLWSCVIVFAALIYFLVGANMVTESTWSEYIFGFIKSSIVPFVLILLCSVFDSNIRVLITNKLRRI
ncbi:hypothetical protein [Pluralibacter gergoviae]|uniref:hypothetical protein n=1 Tax=Pluralibacter gergoviae TaxID=61647 RepID=UPI0038901F56